jgi:hypothetical protein
MTEADRLLYEKGNLYRLHADNLRWTLLGGYGALLIGAVSVADAPPFLLFWGFSIGAYFVLAVQNWFYNLFARYVSECEERIISEKRLRSMDSFARERGPEISPFHPAFVFALAGVAIASGWLAARAVEQLWPASTHRHSTLITLAVLIHFVAFVMVTRQWTSLVYNGLIKRLSNLWHGPQRPGKDQRR